MPPMRRTLLLVATSAFIAISATEVNAGYPVSPGANPCASGHIKVNGGTYCANTNIDSAYPEKAVMPCQRGYMKKSASSGNYYCVRE